MIEDLIMLALTLSTFLFLGSLFLGDSERGRSLARAAAFCFALAFVPPTLAYLSASLFHWPQGVSGSMKFLLIVMVGLIVTVIVPFASYGFLEFRKGGRSRSAIERGYTKERSRRDGHGGREDHR